MDIISSLNNIGLSINESKIYYALIKMGENKAGEISKKLGFNRTTTYDLLQKLIDKGLIAYSINSKTKYFKASNPQQLYNFIKEKEILVEQTLPFLKKEYNNSDSENNILLYKGYKGIKTVFEDIINSLKPKEINRVFDSEGQFTEKMPFFSPHFIKSLEKKKINVKHLVREGIDIKPSKTTQVKYLKNEKISNATIDVYSDKTLLILWEEKPNAVLIQNKSLAELMKYYFEQIWKK
ncbi:MAG: helix-turn-helix domain-containing protein [Candidatus Nanoarchaeia archaeon]|nr:helix-turn-helix domain-containing protein [Candidatus Nanoarchaeia archaeon]